MWTSDATNVTMTNMIAARPSMRILSGITSAGRTVVLTGMESERTSTPPPRATQSTPPVQANGYSCASWPLADSDSASACPRMLDGAEIRPITLSANDATIAPVAM